jgi:hypothetical protein
MVYIRENPNQKWMISGSLISGNLRMMIILWNSEKKTIFADESVFSSRVVSALEMGFWKGSSTTRGSFVRPTRNLQKYERFSPNHAIYSKIPSRKMET